VPGLILLALLVICFWAWRRHRRRVARERAAIAAGEALPRERGGLRRFWSPAVVLFLLAPYVAEGVSGASPVLIFFNPLVLIYFVLFYGSGAMLIREVTLAWGKGWPTRLLLGLAYGICEEGLSTKVFFDPHRTNLGPQMQYGTWAGVHWPYAFHLAVYHAVFSISIPIFLTALLFPERADTPWVRRRTLPVLAATFIVGMLISAIRLYPYNPGVARVGGAVGVVLVLIVLARAAPLSFRLPGRTKVATPRRLAWLGFLTAMTFWIVSYLFAAWHVAPGVTMAGEVVIVVVAGATMLRWTGNAIEWSPYHAFALVFGLMGFFVLGSFLLEALGTLGQSLMGIATATWLLLLRRRLRRRFRDRPQALATTWHLSSVRNT
jgi:hypothetical protein